MQVKFLDLDERRQELSQIQECSLHLYLTIPPLNSIYGLYKQL